MPKYRGHQHMPEGVSITGTDLPSLGFPADGTVVADKLYLLDQFKMFPSALTSGLDGALTLDVVDSGLVDVATDGAATTVVSGLEAGVQIVGVALAITTEIADIDSTTGTLALSGGSSVSVGTVSSFGTDQRITKLLMSDANALLTAESSLVFTLSGGSDNTPSAGAVRAFVYYLKLADI